MSSAYYELYLKQVFDLAGTMVVKCHDAALAINENLRLRGIPVDDTDPSTWKYYLHLSGEYHSTDAPMTVTSIDTLETIPFTKAVLNEHRATRKEYNFHSRYYRELLDRYPDQELLIRGILNPVDINTAIAANDHTILYYDKNLVEGNEVNLIDEVQNYIDRYFHRWDVPDYRLSDPWYVVVQFGIMFAHLPKAIMNIRLMNCKTDYAHSYHIRQYLASNGQLDPYFDFMTAKQKLFFYRNILYINSNNGKQETFEWLTQKVMTDRAFPLSGYSLKHNDTHQAENLKPEIELLRKSVNGLEEPLGNDVKSVWEILEMENNIAKGNPTVEVETEVDVINRMQNCVTGTVETKVLESAVMDLTEAEPFTLSDVILNHWIYFSNIGLYRSIFTVNNPVTNALMSVSVRDAWLLYLYVYNKARGVTLTHIPKFDAKRVIRIPAPSRQELLDMVDPKYVPKVLIDEAMGLYTRPSTYVSIEAFRETCIELHKNMLLHRDLSVYRQHWVSRVQVEMMVDRFYMDFEIHNDATGMYYSDWLKEKGFQVDDLGPEELDIMSVDLYQGATGQKAKTVKTLKEIHAAMCKLMGHLSSYRLQFIPTINSGNMKILDWASLRYGDFNGWSGQYQPIRMNPVMPLTEDSKVHNKVFRRVACRYAKDYDTLTHKKVFVPLLTHTRRDAVSKNHISGELPKMLVRISDDNTVDLSTGLTGQLVSYIGSGFTRQYLLSLDPIKALYILVGEQTGVEITPSRVELVSFDGSQVKFASSLEENSLFANPYVGSGYVALSRLDLSSLGPIKVTITLPTTTKEIMAEIEKQTGIVFVDEDYAVEKVDVSKWNVKASPNSLRWYGSLNVNLV